MRKKIQLYLYILLVLLVTGGLGGCRQKPEDVVRNYLELTYINSRPDEAYELLSSEDQKLKTRELFIREINRKNYLRKKLPKKVRKQYKYEILKTEKNSDTLLVVTKLYRPDAEDIMRELGFFMLHSISGNEDKIPDPENALYSLMNGEPVMLMTEVQTFKVIFQDNRYKICMNAKPSLKPSSPKQKIDEQISQAIKELRLEEALTLLKAKDSMENTTVSQQTSEIQNILDNTLKIGDTITLGNLEITALSAQIRPVKFHLEHLPGEKPKVFISEEHFFVLTCKITNNCTMEFFCPKEKMSMKGDVHVQDNFGNQMHELTIPEGVSTIDSNNYKSFSPGETRIMEFICEAPLVAQAETFLWKIKLNTDNRNTARNVYILHSKKDILPYDAGRYKNRRKKHQSP
jgi:hypothetical protein